MKFDENTLYIAVEHDDGHDTSSRVNDFSGVAYGGDDTDEIFCAFAEAAQEFVIYKLVPVANADRSELNIVPIKKVK